MAWPLMRCGVVKERDNLYLTSLHFGLNERGNGKSWGWRDLGGKPIVLF